MAPSLDPSSLAMTSSSTYPVVVPPMSLRDVARVTRQEGLHRPNIEGLYRTILDNLRDGVIVSDRDGYLRYWNSGAEALTGYSAEEILEAPARYGFLSYTDMRGRPVSDEKCPVRAAVNGSAAREVELYLRHKEGHRIPVRVRSIPLRDDFGAVTGVLEILCDLSGSVELTRRVKELQKLSLTDPLTSLGNRRFLEQHLRARLDEMKRYGWACGILFMDIDHFKKVNDTYGHCVGDRVLQTVAATLANNVRPFDVVGRWSGEEFVSIISNVDAKALLEIAERFRMLVSLSSIQDGEEDISVTVSIGATIAHNSETITSLVGRADRLMYVSKRRGRNQVTSDR